jgi:hypothetical protein
MGAVEKRSATKFTALALVGGTVLTPLVPSLTTLVPSLVPCPVSPVCKLPSSGNCWDPSMTTSFSETKLVLLMRLNIGEYASVGNHELIRFMIWYACELYPSEWEFWVLVKY